MSNSNIFATLAAALPKVSRQPSGGLPSLPEAYALTQVLPTQTNQGTNGSSASDVLQSTLKQASDTISQSNRQLSDLQALQQQLLDSLGQNTQAVNSNTQTKGSGSSDALATAGNVFSGMFGGSILAPIISGLVSLFGGDGSRTQPVLTPFTMPSPVQIETVVNSAAGPQPPASTPNAAGPVQSAAAGFPQVQVQVNAMDSRSFLDHSDEIADAVRKALLNSHSLGDVIAEI